ncbi:hypothetical protein HN858_03985 [Candidatus Falkowbacteria bacterium]|mgnify:CR=1 FL=1|jgi:hypothetical protein|nr:hypothetical protein [Candidatus Falkowbacteria bacterium]MBT5503668.1 hypothetical protein [Candidatus Falkowbacteria bacterium]MBT6574454.1 hypothetical protein [Candidatus Falkowbacteria bacterium]MBT7348807.1 hypothetical protein [Candidatus Falkowbacteria bacterium]MBT7501226.1 hypothetical protein [Candidatus Falkowbacteria bacterium]
MSLGIMICNEHGVALGADSLVSTSRTFFEVNLWSEIKELFDEAQKEGADEVDLAALKAEAMKKMVQAKDDAVIKSFRAKKLFPTFYKDGKPFGGVMTVGDALIDNMVVSVAQEMQKEGASEDLAFEDYMNSMKVRMTVAMEELNGSSRFGSFIFAGYCPVQKDYICYFARVIYKSKVHDNEKKINFDFVKLGSGKLFYPLGDTGVVDRMILGRDTRLPDLLKDKVTEMLTYLLGLCAEGGTLPTEKLPASDLKKMLEDGLKDIDALFEEAKKRAPDGSFDEATDEFDFAGVSMSLGMAMCEDLMQNIREGASIDHMSDMTLRECLKVIKWLIDSTSEFHSYIKNQIPTVGGDVYIATITASEGFVYRTLNDNF